MDLAPLFALMADTNVLKVFHAARQDIEIFHKLMGAVPAPLFDTQVAAMVCGFGESASYETLAGKLAGARIDKSARFTDWSHRPLTTARSTTPSPTWCPCARSTRSWRAGSSATTVPPGSTRRSGS